MRKDHKNSQRDDEADAKDSNATENGVNFSKATLKTRREWRNTFQKC